MLKSKIWSIIIFKINNSVSVSPVLFFHFINYTVYIDINLTCYLLSIGYRAHALLYMQLELKNLLM